MLVERFAEAVCERGLDVESMLVITYTERAAGELRGRIRARLLELGRHDLARSLDGAWISTIHGFCLRLLKSHPFAAGLDPRFRVLDDSQGRVIRGEAFEAALNEFCAGDDPERLRLLATYGAAGLRRMLTTVYETLRSAGRELELELGERRGLAERLAELAEAARVPGRGRGRDRSGTGRGRAGARADADAAAARSAARPERPARAHASGRDATKRRARRSSRRRSTSWRCSDRELLQELLLGFADAYAAAKDRESALDFEDLQLRARDLLRDDERSASASSSASARSWSTSSRTRTGSSARSWICLTGARHGSVLRRRRVPVDLRLPARGRGGLPRAARRRPRRCCR